MSADTHTEIEVKFDASGDVDITQLESVGDVAQVAAPVVVELDAEYFDNADLALLGAGIGLRRRRGGDDAGWHVKIARFKCERVEVHEPLGAVKTRPPAPLRDLVIAGRGGRRWSGWRRCARWGRCTGCSMSTVKGWPKWLMHRYGGRPRAGALDVA